MTQTVPPPPSTCAHIVAPVSAPPDACNQLFVDQHFFARRCTLLIEHDEHAQWCPICEYEAIAMVDES